VALQEKCWTSWRKDCDEREGRSWILFLLSNLSIIIWWIIFYFNNSNTIYSNTIKNVLGIGLVLHSRIKHRNEAKASIHVVLDTPYMSGMVYASTMPPVVGISYLMEWWYQARRILLARPIFWHIVLTNTHLLHIPVNSALVYVLRERERENGKQTVSDREGEGSSLSSSTKSLV
jgi:hypothetical protein